MPAEGACEDLGESLPEESALFQGLPAGTWRIPPAWMEMVPALTSRLCEADATGWKVTSI